MKTLAPMTQTVAVTVNDLSQAIRYGKQYGFPFKLSTQVAKLGHIQFTVNSLGQLLTMDIVCFKLARVEPV